MVKNKNIFVTITGFQHYYGREPFQIGNLIRCAKEPGNPYDSDAIRAFLPYIGKVGYIANSPQTKAGGTESAKFRSPEIVYEPPASNSYATSTSFPEVIGLFSK